MVPTVATSLGIVRTDHYRLWMQFVTDTIVTSVESVLTSILEFSDMEIEFFRFPLTGHIFTVMVVASRIT